ncbi:MAG: HEAT repeat domain-containing protein [Vicinamibacteria bacterium]|nr:HEAT repeat domain-containing protein [Vicinamibacteria bacterium]
MTIDIDSARTLLMTGEESARRRAVDELSRARSPEAIMLLLTAVADEAWTVRQAASDHLSAFDTTPLLPVLETALRNHENATIRNSAMEIYVRLGIAAVPALVALLADDDEEVRSFAAAMLGTVRDSSALRPLIAALQDSCVNTRHMAAASLGQLGLREAVGPLIELLKEEPWLKYPAIYALGEIGDPRATGALVPLLKDEQLRSAVLESLGRFAGRDVLPYVLPFLYDPDPGLRTVTIQAIVSIEQRATDSGDSLAPEVRAALDREELIEHLLDTLADEDVQNRRTAAITLGWLKEARAERTLIELLGDPSVQQYVTHALVSIGFQDREAFEHGLRNPHDAIRQGTIRCLSWIAPPDAVDLVAPLIHDPSSEVRAEAASAIGRLGDEDSAMLLFELLGDDSELIQESAMEALLRLPPARVIPLLLQALGNPDIAVRVRAAETLGLLRDPKTAPALIALTRDPRESARRAAIKALGEIEAPGIPDILRAALLDESSIVRQQAAVSLGKLRDPSSINDLLPLLGDPDPKMRFVVIRALGQIRAAEAVPRLIPLLTDPHKELRFAAVEALGEMRAYSAVPALTRVLQDTDRNLRRIAAESLGQIADPQALPALLLALDDEHWSVRCAAATALGRMRSVKATSALLARIQGEDPTVQRAAVAALGEICDARSTRPLIQSLDDPGLQSTALEALRRMGANALTDIERILPDVGVEARRLLVNLVGKIEDRRIVRVLLSALGDSSPRVRSEAALALGDSGFLEALRPLNQCKTADSSPDVRQAAAIALRKLAPRSKS